MPRRDDLQSILVIGSGPIVIGQACEFDYSGTQACRVLAEEGYRVILANSNPATIMTDPGTADRTYIEPLDPDVLAAIIDKERPDALLPTLGGQTALNLTMQLVELGVLERYGVEVIGARPEAIATAEDRDRFKAAMEDIGLEVPRSGFAHTLEEAEEIAADIGFPIMVRPSFILGGKGTGIAEDAGHFAQLAAEGLAASPVGQILVERSIAGWKEFELEVMRDAGDNCVVVCSIENFDPMGVHTGDSITVAPAQTLTDVEYQAMRDDAFACLRRVGVETGGSNVQFAVDPRSGRRVIIEMNPRVSRSSALASKATGFPIAKIAARLAVGYLLNEIPNDITRATPASFEPTIDYVVTKVPRWAFEKLPGADGRLGTRMQSVGEVMAIGRTFCESLQKALRSLEQGRAGLNADPAEAAVEAMPLDELLERIGIPTPDRVFEVEAALRRGAGVDEVVARTGIDPWFVRQLVRIADERRRIEGAPSLGPADFRRAKRLGFSDAQLAHLRGATEADMREARVAHGVRATFKTVDTCAAEFEAFTPYHYATYEEEDEVRPSERTRVIILGSGPNRIGQGIEFDYCCVHASMALRDAGYETVMVNCNPETVSTDYDTSDRLYFEPLTNEDVANVLDAELAAGGKVAGVIVSLGGQTPLKLAGALPQELVLGTSPASIDLAEDRERWNALCHERSIPQPPGGTASTTAEALAVAGRVGYPVLLRPSYVLGGRAMEIVYDDDGVRRVMQSMTTGALAREGGVTAERPVLVDRFLEDAVEVDVDAVRDGTGEVLIAGVMEHVEEAGVHSGDSACALPPQSLSDEVVETLERHTRVLAESLEVCGLINVQFAVKDGQAYVLEANPRASRTVPFVAKATGVPLAMVASRVMVGQTLAGLRKEGLLPADVIGRVPVLDHVSVKEAVLPFDRFPGVDTLLGPEMRSTGEVMGIDTTFGLAFAKSQLAVGTRLPDSGTVFLSLADRDKPAGLEVARAFSALGLSIAATLGTAGYLRTAGVVVDTLVAKVGEEGVASDAVELIAQGKVQLVVNTPAAWARGRTASTSAWHRWPTRCPVSPRSPRRGRPRRAWPTRGRTRSWCDPCRTCIPSPVGGHGEHASRPAPSRGGGDTGGCPRTGQPGHDSVGDVGARHRAVRVRRAGRAGCRGRQVALRRPVARQPGAAGARGRCRHAQQRRAPGPGTVGLAGRRPAGAAGVGRAGRREHLGPHGGRLRACGRARRGGSLGGPRRLHRGARGQCQLPQRGGPGAHVRPLGGCDGAGHGRHRLRRAPMGQAQPQRARHRRDRLWCARRWRRRVDAGEHAARPRNRHRIGPPRAGSGRRRAVGGCGPPGRGASRVGVPGCLPRGADRRGGRGDVGSRRGGVAAGGGRCRPGRHGHLPRPQGAMEGAAPAGALV